MIKKFYYIFLLILSCNINQLYSQCGVAGVSYILSSQTAVNDFFPTLFPGCTNFAGRIIIEDNNDGIDNITNLDALSSILELGGLWIEDNHYLTNVDGLSALTIIGGGECKIIENDVLTNLDGLSNLFEVDGDLLIEDNNALVDINLENLTYLRYIGHLRIINNDALIDIGNFSSLIKATWIIISENLNLQTIDAFHNVTICSAMTMDFNSNLTTINCLASCATSLFNLQISSNENLLTLSGFDSYTSVGDIQIVFNYNLETIDIMDNLVQMAGKMRLWRNYDLTMVDFPSLVTVDEEISFDRNYRLTNWSGFSSLTTVGDYLSIWRSDSLTELSGFTSLTTVGGNLSIRFNDALEKISGFNSLTNVLAVEIKDNNILGMNGVNDFCGMYNVVNDNGVSFWVVSNNGYNPTETEVLNNGACMLLPVSLTSFTCRSLVKSTLLYWQTEQEYNNQGFEIQRSSNIQYWEAIGFVNGKGESSVLQSYQYEDNNPLEGVNYYRLRQIDHDGSFEYSDIVQGELPKNSKISLYPNPTTELIHFSLPNADQVVIYNTLGHVLDRFDLAAGQHELSLQKYNEAMLLFQIGEERIRVVMSK